MSEKEKYQGHTIEIVTDLDPFNPRDDENICIIHTVHPNYSFGDINYKSFQGVEKARNKAIRDGDMVLPLYMYEHGGITISLSPFSCHWDSGQVGFVQIPRKKMLSEFGGKIFAKKLKARALEVAQYEVSTFDSYLRGEVYEYVVDGEDRCGGFYDEDDVLAEAKGIVKSIIKHNISQHCKKVKMWITKGVPLYARTALEA